MNRSLIKKLWRLGDKQFIDYIDGEIYLKFGAISNNSVETTLKIDDQEVKLEYNGLLLLDKD